MFINILFFLKYKFIYFNWKLTILQYCIGFAIRGHESATGVIFVGWGCKLHDQLGELPTDL